MFPTQLKQKDIVNGFIRRSILKRDYIPECIHNLCLKYYDALIWIKLDYSNLRLSPQFIWKAPEIYYKITEPKYCLRITPVFVASIHEEDMIGIDTIVESNDNCIRSIVYTIKLWCSESNICFVSSQTKKIAHYGLNGVPCIPQQRKID